MSEPDDGRLKVVQITCGRAGEGHTLYALTEDGRVWYQQGGTWLEEPPIPSQASQWRRKHGEPRR